MFCNYCGASLPDDAQFCGACGKSLVQADPGQSNAPVEEAPAAPVQETPSAPEMLYDVSESAPDAAPVPVKPKRNIKRILIAVVAAVVALGIIGGGIAFAMDYFSPEKTLDRAMDKTSDAMSELFEALPGLTRMGENYENLAKSDVLDTRVSLDAADSYESFNVTMHEVFSKKDDLHGFVEFSGQFDGMEIAFEGYVDKDAIQMAAPSLVSGRYALPLANLEQTLPNSYFGQTMDEDMTEVLVLMAQLVSSMGSGTNTAALEELGQWSDYVTVEKVEESIPGAGTLDAVYSYQISFSDLITWASSNTKPYLQEAVDAGELSQEDVQELLMSLNMIGPLLDSNTKILFGVRDGCVTALDVTFMGEKLLTVNLDGGENPWESFRLSVAGEEVLTGSIRATGSTLTCRLEADGETVVLAINDAKQELELSYEGETLFTLGYDAAGDGISFSLDIEDYDIAVSAELTMAPGKDFTMPDSADATNLLTMTEADFEALGMELMEALDALYE